ncbi:MAG TPA: sigma-70 family RNA polymerase sigma factor [Ktedonobacterales bacterium]
MQDEWPDDAVHAGLMKRNPQALEALIRRYSREMSYFIRLVLEGVGTAQDTEECTNDLFVAAWQEVDTFDPARASLRTWLTMRAKYIALDRRRQIQRRQAMLTSLDAGMNPSNGPGRATPFEAMLGQPAAPSMERLVEQRESREELERALEELPELDRYVVYMRYFHIASTEEIARKTGLTRQAIDTRLWRVRKVLRDALGEQAHERVRTLERPRR